MSIVKERDTYFISTTLDASGTFQKDFSFNAVDEIRIVQVIYVSGVDDDEVYRVAWDGVAPCLCLFDVGHQAGNVNIRHNFHGRSVQGEQRFTVYNGNDVIETGLTGYLGIVFETIKY